MGIGLQPALTESLGVARQHADPVRVMSGQVSLQQVLGDELDLGGLTAEAAHQLADGSPQAVDWENERVRHSGLRSLKLGGLFADQRGRTCHGLRWAQR
jgi:hypothetical protein